MSSPTLDTEISVLLPVYNGGEYLKQSVSSVLKQRHTKFELLIVDDCSTDGSREWLQSLNDPRVRLFLNPANKGLFPNLNFLCDQASSPLLKLWAQDDVMYDDCLRHFVDFHLKHPECGYTYCMRDMINAKGEMKPVSVIDNTPELIDFSTHSRITYRVGSLPGNIANVCISKNALTAVGEFDTSMKISADLDMWVRLSEHFTTGFIRKSLMQIRDHDKQLSRNEGSYVLHVEEDLRIYSHLDSVVAPDLRKSGRRALRRNKLMFYYSLFLKAFVSGRWKHAIRYRRAISAYDNFLLLTVRYPLQFLNKKK